VNDHDRTLGEPDPEPAAEPRPASLSASAGLPGVPYPAGLANSAHFPGWLDIDHLASTDASPPGWPVGHPGEAMCVSAAADIGCQATRRSPWDFSMVSASSIALREYPLKKSRIAPQK
jgi:hypothetical protein